MTSNLVTAPPGEGGTPGVDQIVREVAAAFRGLRVAIIHHWFVRLGGGEHFVERLAEMFPQADLFALMAYRKILRSPLRERKLTTSFLQRAPGWRRWHRLYMPLFPLALEQFDLTGYDLILSSESGPAKGVIAPARACHICYCHSPMRYIWEMYPQYRKTAPLGAAGRTMFALFSHYLRQWDAATAARVDYFAANSRTTAARVRRVYRREATVIPGPVRVGRFAVGERREDFYLAVARLVSYKRLDLAIAACNRLGRRLVIIGDGEEAPALRRLAGPSVRLLGRCSDAEIADHYGRCRALLFPGEEDQGLTPIEAQACGAPVIAFGRGGAVETVRGWWVGREAPPDPTGIFFAEQTEAALAEAILFFEERGGAFQASAARAQAENFDVSLFYPRMAAFIQSCLADFRAHDHEPER